MSDVRIFQRNERYATHVTMVVWECPSCGIVYAIPESFADKCRSSGQRYYCPNGHSLGWNETDAQREAKARKQAESDAAFWRSMHNDARDEAAALALSNRALKGHLTRWRNRVANGVCPVAGCHRHFPNVQAHVASVHGEWLKEHPEVFSESEHERRNQ